MSPKVWIVLTLCSSVGGWYVVLISSFVPKAFCKDSQKWDVKRFLWSDMIEIVCRDFLKWDVKMIIMIWYNLKSALYAVKLFLSIQLSECVCFIGFLNTQKMSGFGQTINDNPNRVVRFWVVRSIVIRSYLHNGSLGGTSNPVGFDIPPLLLNIIIYWHILRCHPLMFGHQ